MWKWLKKLFTPEQDETTVMRDNLRKAPFTKRPYAVGETQKTPPNYTKPRVDPLTTVRKMPPLPTKSMVTKPVGVPTAKTMVTQPVGRPAYTNPPYRPPDEEVRLRTPLDDLSPRSPHHESVWDEHTHEATKAVLEDLFREPPRPAEPEVFKGGGGESGGGGASGSWQDGDDSRRTTQTDWSTYSSRSDPSPSTTDDDSSRRSSYSSHDPSPSVSDSSPSYDSGSSGSSDSGSSSSSND